MNDRRISRKKAIVIAVLVFVLIIANLVGIVAGSACSILNKINFLSGDELAIPDDLDSIKLDEESGDIVSGADVFNDADMAEHDAEINQSIVNEDGLMSKKGVKNILVLGIDSRKKNSLKSRSDVIIIATINENTKEITLSSIMRDVYVSIPGKSQKTKINAACAYGGPALAVKTVEQAFGIKIDNFVVFNFYSFMDIVDALGGVTVPISSGEKKYLNNYVDEINRKMGINRDDGKLNSTGDSVKLTGKQAMGYVRIRYVGNGDYERTDRQRRVMEQMIKKAVKSDYGTLMDVMDSVAKNMSTDMKSGDIISMATNVGSYAGYEIKQVRIPVNGSYNGGMYNGQWVLKINFDKNKDALKNAIFGE